jgi:hypothetical protein
LPGVEILDAWPDDGATLPERGITVLMTGKADDEWTTPRPTGYKAIHAAMPAELAVDTATIVDTATAVVALNVLRADYVSHLADTDAHAAADATNGPTVAAASDLPTGILLANNLRTKMAAHEAAAGTGAPHPVADALNAPTAPVATNEATLVALTKNLADCLAAHYAARRYLWMLGSRVQPVQLDIWTTYEAVRDETIGAVEQVVRLGAAQPDGPDVFTDYAPVGLGITVTLGADWPDASAAFDFEAPTRSQDPQAQEWRATYEGTVDVPMLAWGQTARLARAQFTITADGTDRTVDVNWADNADGYTETFAG